MKVLITSSYITLGQFLKHANLVASGGQVKPFISEHTILVNKIRTKQRGKKLYLGDTINVAGQTFILVKE